MNTAAQNSVIAAFAAGVAAWFAASMTVRGRHDRALWMLTGCLLTGATGFALRIPQLYATLDRHLGVPNLAALISNLSLVLTAVFFHLWILLWPRTYSRRTLWTLGTVGVADVAVLAALFALGAHSSERPQGFEVVYLRDGPTAAFTFLYLCTFTAAWPLAFVRCRAARENLRAAVRPQPAGEEAERSDVVEWWHAPAMRLLQAGTAFAALYAAAQFAIPAAALLGRPGIERWGVLFGNIFAGLSAVHSSCGATCGSWGPWMDRRAAKRRIRELQALWDAVKGQAESSPIPDTLVLSGVTPQWAADMQAYRILDGYRTLKPFLDARVAQGAVTRARTLGFRPEEAALLAEAAVVRAAVSAQAAQRLPAVRHEIPEFGQHEVESASDWLVMVSRAMVHVDNAGMLASGPRPWPARGRRAAAHRGAALMRWIGTPRARTAWSAALLPGLLWTAARRRGM